MRAVFFDRDGTLMEDAHYLGDPEKVRVFPGVPEALAELSRAGFGVFVVSNQSGIGRGLITLEQYHAVQAEFLRQIGPGLIDASYYCPDAPGTESACRKPAPGMLLRAAAEHGIDLAQSFMVGDKAADVECGQRAGTRTILVRTGYGSGQVCAADWVCADAVEAVRTILDATSRP
jgi:D-glycero-D-manno-heptose 1,7-bisphosphate phosphatase